jgi:hypothetical protein
MLKIPKRDRVGRYLATWVSAKRSDPIELLTMVIVHDLITKKAELAGGGLKLRSGGLIDSNRVIVQVHRALTQIGLNILRATENVLSLEYRIEELKKGSMRFGDEEEVILFFNQVATSLGIVALLSLEYQVIQQEVFVKFGSDKKRWMDKAQWLVHSKLLGMENMLVTAFQGLGFQHKAVKLTFNNTLDVGTANHLILTNGVAFDIPVGDRNNLARIGRPEYQPEGMTVTLEFRGLVHGVRQVARMLAPHVSRFDLIKQ